MTAQELASKEKQEVQEQNRTRPGRAYVPEVDIREDDSGMYLWVDMPGASQENVRVDLDDNVLTIDGEVSLAEYEGLRPVHIEYNVGRFLRRFTLPGSGRFNQEAISARMSQGVLEIRLPLAEPAKPRRIQVST
jgi:HSP20 family molecular chaperone IbpA